MRALALGVVALALVSSSALGQQDALMQHYHAYSAALQTGDLATADREAASALELSIVRDRNGGHTGVLALNLAIVRIDEGRRHEAIEPAQKALQIAHDDPNAGVDPRLATLIAANATFDAQDVNSANNLGIALQATRADDPWQSDIYAAANALGAWQFARGQYRDAIITMRVAVAAIASASGAPNVKADAQMLLASSLILQGATDGFSSASASEARGALVDALVALHGDIRELEPNEAIPDRERQYATTLAWFRILSGLIASQAIDHVATTPELPSLDVPRRSQTPLCKMSFQADPPPRYPPHQDYGRSVGAVAIHWETDEAGAFRRVEVISSVGADFAAEVQAVMHSWRMKKLDGSPAGCTIATWGIQSVNFANVAGQTSRRGSLMVH